MKKPDEWMDDLADRPAFNGLYKDDARRARFDGLIRLISEVQCDAIESAAAFVEGGSFLHGESGEARLARAAAAGVRRLAADALKILEE